MYTGKNKLIKWASFVLVIIAAVLLLIGGIVAGWNVKEWFSSTSAYIVYVFIILYILLLVFIYTKEWMDRQ